MRMFTTLLLCGLVTSSWSQDTNELGEQRLIPSSSYRMVLSPVSEVMNKKSLQTLEDAISSTISMQQRQKAMEAFTHVEVAVQDVDYIQADDSESVASTRVQFFLLGTSFSNATDEALRLELVNLLNKSFSSVTSVQHFLFLLASDPILMEVATVSVNPVGLSSPPAVDDEPSDSGSKLSLLDILLISACGVILLGILWMVIQHHTDRGYIENERLRLFNRPAHSTNPPEDKPPVPSNDGPVDNHSVSPDDDALSARSESTTDKEEVIPGTPSTTQSVTEAAPTHAQADPITPERIVRITTTTISSASSSDENIASAASSVGSTPQRMIDPKPFLVDSFQDKWMHPRKKQTRLQNKLQSVSPFADKDQETGSADDLFFEDKSDNSEDLFHLDMCSSSEGSRASAASAVTEWMKTIRVVTTTVDQFVSESLSLTSYDNEEKTTDEATLELKGPESVHSTEIEEDEGPSSTMCISPSATHSSSSSSLFSSSASSSGFSTGTSTSTYDTSLMDDLSSKLEEGSLDHLSLERSMASSCADNRSAEQMEI